MEKKKLFGVQVLRGVLAMLVFVQHVFACSSTIADGPTDWLYLPNFAGVGVMTFFALSGYVMVQKLEERRGKFIIDRLRRVYPTLWISLLFAGTITLVISGETGLTWQLFLLIPAGTFPTVPMPYWTLYWELFFYLIVAATMSLGRRAFWGWLTAWTIGGLLAWHRPWGQHLAFPGWYDLAFNPFAVFFLSGALAHKLQNRFTADFVKVSFWTALVFLFAIPMLISKGVVGSVLLPNSSWPFISVAVGAFFAIIAAVHWHPAKGARAFWVKIGDWSYGIYLIHIVPMVLTVHWLKAFQITGSFWVSAVVLAVVAFGPAILMGLLDVAIQRRLKRTEPSNFFRRRLEV